MKRRFRILTNLPVWTGHAPFLHPAPNFLHMEKIVVPEFQIEENPTISLSELRERRFNLIDRDSQVARLQIQAEEDANIFRILDEIFPPEET